MSKELERKGADVIHLDVGEPDFQPPHQVVAATRNALSEDRGRYTAAAGISELRNSIARHLNAKYATQIGPEQVLFTAGGRLGLYLAFLTLPKRAKVGIITPDWPAYRDICKMMDFQTVFFTTSLENSWAPDLSELESADFDALVLNYPNNPTGKILDSETFDRITEIIARKNALIISDEVYSEYVFLKPGNFRSLLQAKQNTRFILATSLSKSYAMTGYRAGYLISDKATIGEMERINSIILTSAPEFVQYGAIAALECADYVRDKLQLIEGRRDIAVKTLRECGYSEFHEPEGSLYVFPKIRGARGPIDSEALALHLLETAHVSVTPGTVFGEQFRDFIRITLLQNEERIEKGIRLIGSALKDF